MKGPSIAAHRIALLALCLGGLLATEQGHEIGAALEASETAFYPGQDLVVKMIFRGAGQNEATIAAAAFAREAFSVKGDAGQPPGKVSDASPQGSGPTPLAVHGFDEEERLVNLSIWYPRLTRKTGSWEIAWSYGSMKAGPIKVRVIAAYRPVKDKVALVETDLGSMTWELLPEIAPEHVKHFVDLARTGFYDGLSIFRVLPGLQADGGDPKGDGTGAWSRVMRPEISTKVKTEVGLIGAARQETSMTSDSMFFITLGPSDFMLGKQTFYARVTKGADVVARLQHLPSKGDTGFRDSYLLITPVKIHRIEIE